MALPPNRTGRYLRFSTVGLELGLSVLIGLFLGQWLDRIFDTEPWLLLLFLIFGMIAGFRSIYRLLRDLNAEENRPSDSDDTHRPPSGS